LVDAAFSGLDKDRTRPDDELLVVRLDTILFSIEGNRALQWVSEIGMKKAMHTSDYEVATLHHGAVSHPIVDETET
jgi:hypothetical protein